MSVRSRTEPRGPGPLLRIGELSRRTGVAPDTLRAWERRYGLLQPTRSQGGFRLYGRADEGRVRAMQALIESGVAASEAARQALADRPSAWTPGASAAAPDIAARLRAALERFDEAEANSILDGALASLTVEAVARIVLSAMREIGDRWESGEVSVAQEHFATGVVRSRLLGLARNWGAGVGPLALLACLPGERHDLGLLSFGLALHERGWRITYLGPDTPMDTVARAAGDLRPDAVVLAALSPERVERCAAEIASLSHEARVMIGGEAAGEAIELGAEPLEPDPIRAARWLAESV
jgi:MerR family transcriptional regulator, light-induced transcriptional regulator